MNKEQLKYVIGYYSNFRDEGKGGTKEAVVKVTEYLKNHKSSSCCVSEEEFFDSVRILVAFAHLQPNAFPKMCHCNEDCCHITDFWCYNKPIVSDTSKELCEYFADEGNI